MVLLIAIIVGVAVFCLLHGYIALAIVCLFGFSKRYGWPALLTTSTFLFWHRHWFVALLPPLLIMWNIWGLRIWQGGTSHYNGQGVPQDDTQEAFWLRKAAEQGNASAQYILGSVYDYGLGVPQDYAEAALAEAALWYRKAAEQGNAEAQYDLGELYDRGRGVPQDYTQAAFWWRKAGEQGNALAQYHLGLLYDNGRGVPQDYAQAALWYRKAAEQGEAEAQYNLGVLYRDGYGVPQDYAEACFWFDLASAGKTSVAEAEQVAKFRDRAASHLTPVDLARVQERARKWFEDHQAKPQRRKRR